MNDILLHIWVGVLSQQNSKKEALSSPVEKSLYVSSTFLLDLLHLNCVMYMYEFLPFISFSVSVFETTSTIGSISTQVTIFNYKYK